MTAVQTFSKSRQPDAAALNSFYLGNWFLALLLLLFTTPLSADETSPKFHIDTPVHAGRVKQLLVTADERFLVTGGFDHTIRLWDSKTGQQVQRWILPNEDDRIHALALSRNDKILAVGGDIAGPESEGAVLLLSLQTGRIVKTISGFRARVSALAFSPDGEHLAVGFGGPRDISRPNVNELANLISSAQEGSNAIEAGIGIFSTLHADLVFADALGAAPVDSLTFNPSGSLAAATQDSNNFTKLAVYRRNGASYLRQASTSVTRHAGSKLVWRSDSKSLLLGRDGEFNANTLEEIAAPSAPSANDISVVSFLPDGTPVGAFGLKHDGEGLIRTLSDSNQRLSKTPIRIPDTHINDLQFLSGDRIAYIADSGSIAMLDAEGRVIWRNTAASLNFRGKAERLLISGDGQWVALRYQTADGFQEIAFHLESGRFAPLSSIKDWREPLTNRNNVNLLAWQGTSVGTANGTYFPLRKDGERSWTALVHPTDRTFFYGTDAGRLYKATPSYVRNWRYTSAQSLLMWVRLLGSDVVALNLIEDKDLVVVATADGMLRLVRVKDGAIILSYYIEPGERRWLSIAETGHYEASVGGDNLGGWVVRQDAQRASEFLPLSRFREQFLLPGMMKQVLASGDASSGVQLALAGRQAAPLPDLASETAARKLPPVQAEGTLLISEFVEIESPRVDQIPPTIDIVSPGFETTVTDASLTISIRVLTPKDAPLKGVFSRVLSAGQVTRGLHPGLASVEQIINLKLPPEDVEVHLIAENRWGSSLPKIIRVRYTGPKAPPVARQRTLRVLAIGVSDYDNPAYRLYLAAKDANDFGRLLSGQRGKLYEKVELTLLTDKTAEKPAIEQAFASLKKQVKSEDTTFIFLAGHGVNDLQQGYFFMPKEADIQRLKTTGVSFREIRRTLAELPGRNLLFVDTCHAGNVIGGITAGLSQNNSAAINELASPENNIIVFASSSGDQEAIEKDEWGNGAFTKALLEGMRGQADFMKRGRISYKQLDAYVADRVNELTEGQQTPVTPVLVTVPDFPLVEVMRN